MQGKGVTECRNTLIHLVESQMAQKHSEVGNNYVYLPKEIVKNCSIVAFTLTFRVLFPPVHSKYKSS